MVNRKMSNTPGGRTGTLTIHHSPFTIHHSPFLTRHFAGAASPPDRSTRFGDWPLSRNRCHRESTQRTKHGRENARRSEIFRQCRIQDAGHPRLSEKYGTAVATTPPRLPTGSSYFPN